MQRRKRYLLLLLTVKRQQRMCCICRLVEVRRVIIIIFNITSRQISGRVQQVLDGAARIAFKQINAIEILNDFHLVQGLELELVSACVVHVEKLIHEVSTGEEDAGESRILRASEKNNFSARLFKFFSGALKILNKYNLKKDTLHQTLSKDIEQRH